jgi:hypothetical protein
MSLNLIRKSMIAAAAIASAVALSTPAFAFTSHGGSHMGGGSHFSGGNHFGGGHFGGGNRISTNFRQPGHNWRRPGWNWHPHYHRIFVGGRWIVREVGYVEPVAVVAPGPCTCLTKEYTPDGTVVFKDLCTKEMAAAPVAGPEKTSEAAPSSNFAGKTYQDYLAANQDAPKQN